VGWEWCGGGPRWFGASGHCVVGSGPIVALVLPARCACAWPGEVHREASARRSNIDELLIEACNLMQVSWCVLRVMCRSSIGKVMELLSGYIKVDSLNYPETLGAMVIINAPMWCVLPRSGRCQREIVHTNAWAAWWSGVVWHLWLHSRRTLVLHWCWGKTLTHGCLGIWREFTGSVGTPPNH
jgi:hypothetical protein